ncbi:MAG: hypothetical protein PVF43_02275 [Candidatus Eiseniibacteriota bacterium]|jgi:hypothetical protein
MTRTATPLLACILACLVTGPSRAQSDGTLGVDAGSPGSGQGQAPVYQDQSAVILNPVESVSMSQTTIWRDNRLRAYYNALTDHVDGYLLFDVSTIPDGSTVTELRLLCYLEDDFNSPFGDPAVDVYYSADDGWTRASASPGLLSLDTQLADDIVFGTYVPTHEFVLDVAAHDWSGDLVDDQICLGVTNDRTSYGYVYFYGAGGEPIGPPPELTIVYDEPIPVGATTWGAVKQAFHRSRR